MTIQNGNCSNKQLYRDAVLELDVLQIAKHASGIC